MKKVIVAAQDVPQMLSYFVSYGYDATCINKEYQFMDKPMKFIFRLNKPLEEIDYANIKRNAPSFDLYSIYPPSNKRNVATETV